MRIYDTLPKWIAECRARDGFECWNWPHGRQGQGYGMVYVPSPSGEIGTWTLAHRVIYELLAGPIPPGMELDHLCRNRACVNPAHLEVVTHASNMGRSGPATKLHCKRGHLLAGDNLYRTPRGNRRCRICALEQRRRNSGYKGLICTRDRAHCIRGHPLTGDNISIKKHGYRRCLTCHREGERRRKEAKLHGTRLIPT